MTMAKRKDVPNDTPVRVNDDVQVDGGRTGTVARKVGDRYRVDYGPNLDDGGTFLRPDQFRPVT